MAVSPEIGDVLLDERAVRDSQGHGRMNRAKAEAFAAVKDVIERGRVVRRVPASDALDSIYISAPVKIGDVDDVVTVLVHRDVNTQRMYLHSVTTKESLRDGRVSGADAQASQRSGSSQGGGDLTVLHDALNFNGEVSKAVDPETGEPRVMYHGTHRDISAFNTPIAWATADPRHASGYAESGAELRDNGAGAAVVMPAYVSVQRPFNAPGGYLNIGELIDEAVKQAADQVHPISAMPKLAMTTSQESQPSTSISARDIGRKGATPKRFAQCLR